MCFFIINSINLINERKNNNKKKKKRRKIKKKSKEENPLHVLYSFKWLTGKILLNMRKWHFGGANLCRVSYFNF